MESEFLVLSDSPFSGTSTRDGPGGGGGGGGGGGEMAAPLNVYKMIYSKVCYTHTFFVKLKFYEILSCMQPNFLWNFKFTVYGRMLFRLMNEYSDDRYNRTP